MYADLIYSLPHLLENENNPIANCANFSALLYEKLADLNWVGFYFLSGSTLLLGPFVGKVACTRIESGKGVCGTAISKRKTIVVEDVHQFEGHIACDPNSQSEIVIPIEIENKLIGVLDIDSPIIGRFTNDDQQNLEVLLQSLIQMTDFKSLSKYYNSLS